MKKVVLSVLIAGMLFAPGVSYAGTAVEDMMPVLEKVKAQVQAKLAGIDAELAGAAGKLASVDFKSNKARQIIAGLCKDRPYVFECTLIDTNGKLSIAEPEAYRSYEGRDVGSQAQVKELFNTKKPVLSGVFRCIEGVDKVDFLYPVKNSKGELIGAVSLLVSQDVLLKDIIEPLVKDGPAKVWVMQTDGLDIYDPDPNQINRNIFSDPMFAPFKSLIEFSKKVAEVPGGIGTYDFYKKGLEDKTVVKKSASWDTVSLYGTQWRIIVMEIEE